MTYTPKLSATSSINGSAQGSTTPTIRAGLDKDMLASQIAKADFIVFHAALYSNFADSEIEAALKARLAMADTPLDCWLIEARPQRHWVSEFYRILRPSLTQAEIDALFQRSFEWCKQLAQGFAGHICHIRSQSLPLAPLLIIDNTLFVGQYLHSNTGAADGLWLRIDTDSLGLQKASLKDWFYQNLKSDSKALPRDCDTSVNHPLSPELTAMAAAIKRMVDECAHAALCGLEPNIQVGANACH